MIIFDQVCLQTKVISCIEMRAEWTRSEECGGVKTKRAFVVRLHFSRISFKISKKKKKKTKLAEDSVSESYLLTQFELQSQKTRASRLRNYATLEESRRHTQAARQKTLCSREPS